MQTTLRIDDDIYRRAKAKSGELGLSLTRFFEEAVEERLARLTERPQRKIRLPVSSTSAQVIGFKELRSRMESTEVEDDVAELI